VDQIRLLAAAETLRLRPGRGTNQGLRDYALMATLLGTGLRVSELLRIEKDQYNGKGFTNVLRKGGHVQKFIPVQKSHRVVLDEWLHERGDHAGAGYPRKAGHSMLSAA
jgi:integrase/recombinase XerD